MSERPRPDRFETVAWFLFAGGGVLAAFLLPVHILVQGILGPLGVVSGVDQHYDTFARALSNPLVKIYLVVLVGFPMWHWAHRFHFWLHHIGIHAGRRVIPAFSYLTAVAVTLVAVYLVATTP